MIKRIIEISNPAYLSVTQSQLVIKQGEIENTIPIEDIGFIVIDNPQVTITLSLLRHCASEDVCIISCDEKHLPTGQFLSLDSHSTQGKIMRSQIKATDSHKTKIWATIVKAKILAQSNTLVATKGTSHAGILRLFDNLNTDNANSSEALAARYYFKALLGHSFRRDINETDANTLLNYGYTLIRSACARALCSSGLHPAFGLQHHNQYNMFCLADDIMEPLRPLVDNRVINILEIDGSNELTRSAKNKLLLVLSAEVTLKQRKMPLMTALNEYCASLRRLLIEGKGQLMIPTYN